MQTGHPFELNAVADSQPPEYPVTEFAGPPDEIDVSDLSSVIGGFRYKYRVTSSSACGATKPRTWPGRQITWRLSTQAGNVGLTRKPNHEHRQGHGRSRLGRASSSLALGVSTSESRETEAT